MSARKSAKGNLLRQMSEMQIRLQEAEDTLNAIRGGAVDALVVRTPRGEQLFTLKGADQSYRALVEAMSEGAVTLNRDVISYCNNHFAEMLGIPMEKIFGASIFSLVQKDNFPDFIRRLQKGKMVRGQMEAKLRTACGPELPVIISASRFQSEGKAAVGLVVTDISERKNAEQARRELSRSILNAQEQERQRVARDLHDGVNQVLSAAKIRLSDQVERMDAAARNRNIDQARQLVEKAIAEVRIISRNLRPSELDDLGLMAAMRSLTHDFQRRTGITSRFRSDASIPANIPKEIEMALYRIAQEALNNAEKHSRASRVDVSVHFTGGDVLLAVRDDGRGFVSSVSLDQKMGWGLENMTERAALLGGYFHVVSAPKKGTEVTVRIPIPDVPSQRRRNK